MFCFCRWLTKTTMSLTCWSSARGSVVKLAGSAGCCRVEPPSACAVTAAPPMITPSAARTESSTKTTVSFTGRPAWQPLTSGQRSCHHPLLTTPPPRSVQTTLGPNSNGSFKGRRRKWDKGKTWRSKCRVSLSLLLFIIYIIVCHHYKRANMHDFVFFQFHLLKFFWIFVPSFSSLFNILFPRRLLLSSSATRKPSMSCQLGHQSCLKVGGAQFHLKRYFYLFYQKMQPTLVR